jgi:hypothetical protein
MIELNRMVIYTKDIQRITGKSERYGRKVLNKIRKTLCKGKHQPVSMTELCDYLGLDPDEVARYL